MPLADDGPDHRASIELATIDAHRAAEAVVVWGYVSDRMQERKWNLFIGCLVGAIGLIIAGSIGGSFWSLAAMCLATIGFASMHSKTCARTRCFHEPMVNRTYADMARHHGTAIVPARPYKPRDKAKGEVGVQVDRRKVALRAADGSYEQLTSAKACCHVRCRYPRMPGDRHQRAGASTESQSGRTRFVTAYGGDPILSNFPET